jgi:serine phosphatase RsbU (regulator of sigma subunit)
MKHLILLILVLAGLSATVNSQSRIKKLEKELKGAKGESRYSILYQLSKRYLPVSAKKSINFGKEAYEVAIKLKSKNKQANALNLIGTAYFEQRKYRQAIKNYEKEYEIRKELRQNISSTKTLFNIGSIYESWNKKAKAIKTYSEVLELSKKYNRTALAKQCYNRLIHLYDEGKHYKDGFLIVKEYLDFSGKSKLLKEQYKISILETRYEEEKKLKEEVESKLTELDSSYAVVQDQKETLEEEKEVLVKDTAKKSIEITDLTIETEEKEIAIQEQKEKVRRQRQWMIAFGTFFVVVSILSILLFRLYRGKKKANQQLALQNAEILEKNEEINAQAEELKIKNSEIEESKEEIMQQAGQLVEALDALTIQKDEIQKKNSQIMDSINYASKIQKAMLPQEKTIAEGFSETMLLFLPQNIVSGDFYWYRKLDDYLVFVTADCTGHGVPGAFMSMLGMSFLNEVVKKDKTEKPAEILDILRQKVKTSLKQTKKNRMASDGMDMSLCILDTKKNLLHFAGANNPLYIIRKKQLHIVKADPQPVSIYLKEDEFTHHKIEIQKGDCIYIFSDGYIDQFGGQHGDKFKSKRFKELLITISDQPMSEQKIIMEQMLEEWMHDKYAQLDDILVLGVKI